MLHFISFHLFIHQSTSRWYNKNVAKTGKTAAVWNNIANEDLAALAN